jgi:iron complex transport system ATP-binding protein
LHAAYLPQKPQAVWPVKVEDLIALGRFVHGGAPEHLSARDQAAVDAAIEACGLSALRSRRVDQISGGERMRAHLARTLTQGASLLLLDEPTAGLDPAQSLGVSGILRRHAAAGGAVVIATHDVALAAGCADLVMLLHRGRTLAIGAPGEVLTPTNIEAAYGRKGRLERLGEAFAAVFE